MRLKGRWTHLKCHTPISIRLTIASFVAEMVANPFDEEFLTPRGLLVQDVFVARDLPLDKATTFAAQAMRLPLTYSTLEQRYSLQSVSCLSHCFTAHVDLTLLGPSGARRSYSFEQQTGRLTQELSVQRMTSRSWNLLVLASGYASPVHRHPTTDRSCQQFGRQMVGACDAVSQVSQSAEKDYGKRKESYSDRYKLSTRQVTSSKNWPSISRTAIKCYCEISMMRSTID